MGLLHDFVEQLMLEFEKEHSDMSEDEMLSFFIDSLTKSIPEVSDVIFKSILKTIPDILPHIQSDISEFVERNIYYWQKGLNLLEVLNSVNLEIGESTWKEWDIENTNEEHKREVLRRLHVKSCQVVAEIICLLKNGFADGALARWRTLHEIATFMFVISDNNEQLAERFIDYYKVERYNSLVVYEKRRPVLGYKPIDKKHISRIENDYKVVQEKYGSEFSKAYGWASKIITKKGRINFYDIENKVGMGKNKPFFKMACDRIHLSCGSIFSSLGNEFDDSIVLAGPSNTGLSTPAILTAISISQIISALTTAFKSKYDLLIYSSIAKRYL